MRAFGTNNVFPTWPCISPAILRNFGGPSIFRESHHVPPNPRRPELLPPRDRDRQQLEVNPRPDHDAPPPPRPRPPCGHDRPRLGPRRYRPGRTVTTRTARRVAQIRPTPTATPAQTSQHCASIAATAADGRNAEALDLLQDASNAGFASPLLALVDAALLPAAAAYVEHVGNVSPVPACTLVAADLGEGRPLLGLASAIYWGPGLGPAGEGRVRQWARVATVHT